MKYTEKKALYKEAFECLNRANELLSEIEQGCEQSVCELNDITKKQLYSCDPTIINNLYGLNLKGKESYINGEYSKCVQII